MLRDMTMHDAAHDDQAFSTLPPSDFAAGRFEPCPTFEAHDAGGVCAACGWLESDHDRDADVVRLQPVVVRAMRRAS